MKLTIDDQFKDIYGKDGGTIIDIQRDVSSTSEACHLCMDALLALGYDKSNILEGFDYLLEEFGFYDCEEEIDVDNGE